MKKTLLSLVIILAVSVSLFGESTHCSNKTGLNKVKQSVAEDSLLVSAEGAKVLLLNSLSSSYEQNKESCDKALRYADDKIKTDAGNLKSTTLLTYDPVENGSLRDGMSDSYRFYTMCPVIIIKYQIEKRGYSTEVRQNNYGATDFKVNW
jgi:hypothetical protein